MNLKSCGLSDGDYISLGHYEKDDLKAVIDHLKLTYSYIDK